MLTSERHGRRVDPGYIDRSRKPLILTIIIGIKKVRRSRCRLPRTGRRKARKSRDSNVIERTSDDDGRVQPMKDSWSLDRGWQGEVIPRARCLFADGPTNSNVEWISPWHARSLIARRFCFAWRDENDREISRYIWQITFSYTMLQRI